MTDAVRFRTQAAKCATLAKQTHDEESRQRYLRLEQTYLHLAESEDQLVGQSEDQLVGRMSAFVRVPVDNFEYAKARNARARD